MEFKICCRLLTVRGEVGCKKIKMLTVVDGRRGERVGSKNVKVLLLTVEGKAG